MIKVCFKRQIAAGMGTSSDDLLFSYVIDLPFLPVAGMEFYENDWECVVDRLGYADGIVFAYEAPNRTPDLRYRTPEEMEELKKNSLQEGWTLSKDFLKI